MQDLPENPNEYNENKELENFNAPNLKISEFYRFEKESL